MIEDIHCLLWWDLMIWVRFTWSICSSLRPVMSKNKQTVRWYHAPQISSWGISSSLDQMVTEKRRLCIVHRWSAFHRLLIRWWRRLCIVHRWSAFHRLLIRWWRRLCIVHRCWFRDGIMHYCSCGVAGIYCILYKGSAADHNYQL